MSHNEKPDKAQRIPTWDGEPSKFDEFKQRVRLHVLGTRQNERALITARIAGSLTGKAWQIVEDLPEEKKEEMLCTGTCDLLLEFLKESLMDSAVPEAGRFVREYLYKFRRAKSESMKLYVQRHRTLLGKLEKAMRLVEQSQASFWQNLKPKLTPAQESEDSETESDAEEEPLLHRRPSPNRRRTQTGKTSGPTLRTTRSPRNPQRARSRQALPAGPGVNPRAPGRRRRRNTPTKNGRTGERKKNPRRLRSLRRKS